MRLHTAVLRDRPTLALLSVLMRDTSRHFSTEERLMRVHGYPESAGHHALHQGVLNEMLRLQTQRRRGLPMHRKHAAMIADWLEHHVSEADRNLVTFLKRLITAAAAGR